ncbi:MAG TPA: hypothetical protein VE152_01230, partial [Acidimicrobiales bacterium]|nr:hypothetical protein [Acidimicrobiales bacterium]
EELFTTPQQVDLADLASAYGAEVEEVGEARSVGPALADAVAAGGLRLLRIRTDRAANVAVHEELHHAVGAALVEAGLSGPPVGPGVPT